MSMMRMAPGAGTDVDPILGPTCICIRDHLEPKSSSWNVRSFRPAARRTGRRGHRDVQQNVCDVVDNIRSQWGGTPIELRVQDDARMGQKNKRPRRRARRGTRPRAPHDQRTEGACLFGALCPARAKGDGRVMPWCDTHAMAEPSSSSVNRSRPGHTPS